MYRIVFDNAGQPGVPSYKAVRKVLADKLTIREAREQFDALADKHGHDNCSIVRTVASKPRKQS